MCPCCVCRLPCESWQCPMWSWPGRMSCKACKLLYQLRIVSDTAQSAAQAKAADTQPRKWASVVCTVLC